MKDNFETEDFAFLQDIDLTSYREEKRSREKIEQKKTSSNGDAVEKEDYLYSEPVRRNEEDFYHEEEPEKRVRHRERDRNKEREPRKVHRNSNEYHESVRRRDSKNVKRGKRRPQVEKNNRRKNEKIGFFENIADAVANMSTVDHILALTGVVVVFILVVTITFFFSTRIATKQIGEFAGIGEELSAVSVMGESSLVAAAESFGNRQDGSLEEIDWDSESFGDEDADGESDENQGVDAISLNMTSVEKDLKIKFVNKKNGKLIKGIAFKVDVITPSGGKDSYTNNDKDGIIYKKDMTPGEYSVALVEIDEIKDYEYSTSPVKVTVKDHIEYKKIDVADEVKTEAEVNVAAEDTKKKEAESAPVLKDTVEWVESTKKIISHDGEDTNDGENSYIRVSKDDVENPEKNNESSDAGLSALSILRGGSFSFFTISGGDEDCKHESWSSWEVTEEATCTKKGIEERKCSDCHAVETKEIDISTKNHKWGSWEDTEKATCKDEGKEKRTCSECNKEETRTIEKTSDHKWSDYDDDGKKTCSVCGKTETDISKHSHKWGSWENGKRKCTVSGCSEEETCEHKNTEVKTENGKKKTICTTCKEVVSETDADSSISGIEISGKTTFKVDEEVTITAKVSGSNLKEKSVTWKAKTNDKIVSEEKNDGDTLKLKGLKAGTATYTVKYDDGKSSSSKDVTITVEEKGKLTISLSAETMPCLYNKHAEVKVTVSGGSPDYTYTFKSDDERYIRVRSDDKIVTKDTSVILDVKRVDTEENQKNPKATKVYITVTDSNGLKAEKEVTFTAADTTNDKKTPLKDKKGNQLYVRDKETDKYREAVAADYYVYEKFYRLNDSAEYAYTGWQNINGKSYYFDKNGKKVTGDQVIKGVKYSFDDNGVLAGSSGNNAGGAGMGIDVSKWNGSIDWQKVKDNGVEFVIIRCGYRGSSTGALIQDPKFKAYVSGARAVGLKIGVYFFTQAVNEVEAVEEASMVLSMINGAGLSYPVYLDVEASGGRGDAIDKGTRTAVINAFCKTIQNGGYKVGVYANKTWLESKIGTGSLNTGNIWLAQYTEQPSYGGKFNMWQYTSKGQINGISGYVDLNKAY